MAVPDDIAIPLGGDGFPHGEPGTTLRIGVINNMPDPALRRTEQQLRSLLGAALGEVPVDLVLVTLPQIQRSDWAARHVAESYRSVEDFVSTDLDAVIVTGAEPRAARLQDEPYWSGLTALFDWIEEARLPAAYCCLAAHAAVLHRDGIERRRLAQKCFGIFEHHPVIGHGFVRDAEASHVLPHSRWNEITEDDLVAHGYAILSRSDAVGVGAFAGGPAGRDLYFQAHPEYSSTTLLREYRRDVRRFLTRERDTYPEPPFHGINETTLAVFEAFRLRALRDRGEALFEEFPAFDMTDARALPWRPAGATIYRNWLIEAVPVLRGHEATQHERETEHV